jgi:hypothetical protein
MKASSLHGEPDIEPHERLLAKVIRVAIADAKQTRSLCRQQEALEFLWLCFPAVAQQVALPMPPHIPYLKDRS